MQASIQEGDASMDDDDAREPGQPEPTRKTDQEIFDEQIARASGKFIVQLGGLGILAAPVIQSAGRSRVGDRGAAGWQDGPRRSDRRRTRQPPGNCAAARLDPNGAHGQLLRHRGQAQVSFGGDDACFAVAVQRDGKLVVAGKTTVAGSSKGGRQVERQRLLDSTFGTGGSDHHWGPAAAARVGADPDRRPDRRHRFDVTNATQTDFTGTAQLERHDRHVVWHGRTPQRLDGVVNYVLLQHQRQVQDPAEDKSTP